jgi:uncharacterized protein YegL
MKTKILISLLIITSIITANIKARESSQIQSILLLIDVSGSMEGAKIDSVKNAAKSIIKMLLPCKAEFSVMGYSGASDNPIQFQHGFTTNKNELFTFIDKLKPNSNTPLGAALKAASYYFKANKNSASTKQTIILLGDGRSDDNISEALKELKERSSLIQCECIGFCIQNDKQAEEQLKLIAHETKGEYYVATEAANVIKAYIKSSIKTIIGDVPVVVRSVNGNLNLQKLANYNFQKITNQNWIVDSIQINVTPDIYTIAQFISGENVQDTLPKSIVFDSNKKVSLFINNGSSTDENTKWIEGRYFFDKNALTINLPEHYLRLVIKQFNSQSMILCVNRYKSHADSTIETSEEICDCGNKVLSGKPTILVYFSQPGCDH